MPTEERNSAFGQALLIFADAIVGPEICGFRELYFEREGRFVAPELLGSEGILALRVLDDLPIVTLPVVDGVRVGLDRALQHRGRAVVAAHHLAVNSYQGRDWNY